MLQDQNIPHQVRWFIAEPFSRDELTALLGKLGMSASELVRRSEPYFQENFSGRFFTEDDWLRILLDHPELIERPIVERSGKALVARPAERINELL